MSNEPNDSSPIRRTTHYSGQVQGVGFRYTVAGAAESLDVTGFVRNLPDGRVEVVAEGAPAELNRLQQAVSNAMSRHITDVRVSDGDCTGEFSAFGIAFH